VVRSNDHLTAIRRRERAVAVASCQRDDQVAMHGRLWARQHNQPAVRLTREGFDRAHDLTGVMNAGGDGLHTERRRRCFDCAQESRPCGVLWILQQRDPAHARRNFFEQLKPFPAHRQFEMREPGDVAAGLRQTCDQAELDRIGDLYKHDSCEFLCVARSPARHCQEGRPATSR
jgi:hypothetical protein